VAVWSAMLLLAAAVALFVAAPLAEMALARRTSAADDTRARLEHDRGLALAAILELEFDHAMGKIADAEFASLRARLETRALTAMEALAGARTGSSRAAPEHAPSAR
jgi:cytochrome c-type biogenesis protein CcmH/NrfG